MARSNVRLLGGLLIAVLLLAVVAGILLLRDRGLTGLIPGQQRCVARAGDSSVAVDLDQAHFASIVVGISVKRGLPPRAASIALATVYQETGIRNLDQGDRDSVGLFQQRPSQGWGTKKQLMDPYYATNKFYDALLKVDGWESGDINDVAQRVQVSGHPEAYRQHETNARVLASTLTGSSPAGFSCLERKRYNGDAAGLMTSLKKTFGTVPTELTGNAITISAKSEKLAWAYAHYALANSSDFGVSAVRVGDQSWQTDSYTLPAWGAATPSVEATTVTITVKG